MDEKPDLIVAIDYGMTCTGVAYANLTRGDNVHYIQKWPGRAQANENKVPTVVVYDKATQQISSWGFMSETRAEQSNHNREYCDWFKTFLDPTVLQRAQQKDPSAPKSQAEVDKWTEDYMRLLYQHVEFKLSSELPAHKPWPLANVEFIFSVPTTWTPHPTVENFKTIANRAGFGVHAKHTLNIGLTEAEAAAVHVSVESPGIFQENQVLLVCDAGGGTTDLSVMRVSGVTRGFPSLQQLDVVNGKNIGSTQIDDAFDSLVQSRLEAANQILPMNIDIEAASWMMMKSSQYQGAKCDYGSPDDVNFYVSIPGLDISYFNPQFSIQTGQMMFTLSDLQTLFDAQIDPLFALIDGQIQNFRQKFPTEQISHLILSGGLGNSAYVQRKLKERYGMASANTLQVNVSTEPQLAVCKGIVADRVQKYKGGKAVLGWRCCRASYGTICKILYNKNNPEHYNRATWQDPLNGKHYINQAIAWFIKKGEPVDVDKPMIHNFSRKLTPGDPRRAFPLNVVVSHIDKQYLPLQVNADAETLCEIKSDLSGADEKKFKKKNRHWWQFKAPYYRVDYQVRVVIGPADIRFELWFDGQKLSNDNPITVEWVAAAAPAMAPVDHGVYEMPKGFAQPSVMSLPRVPVPGM